MVKIKEFFVFYIYNFLGIFYLCLDFLFVDNYAIMQVQPLSVDIGIELANVEFELNSTKLKEKLIFEAELIIMYDKKNINNINNIDFSKDILIDKNKTVEILNGQCNQIMGTIEKCSGYLLYNNKKIDITIFLLINTDFYKSLQVNKILESSILQDNLNQFKFLNKFDIRGIQSAQCTKWSTIQDTIDTFNFLYNKKTTFGLQKVVFAMWQSGKNIKEMKGFVLEIKLINNNNFYIINDHTLLSKDNGRVNMPEDRSVMHNKKLKALEHK